MLTELLCWCPVGSVVLPHGEKVLLDDVIIKVPSYIDQPCNPCFPFGFVKSESDSLDQLRLT